MIDVHLSPIHVYINNKVIVNEFSRYLQGYIIISFIPSFLACTAVYGSSHGRTSNLDDFSTFLHKTGSYLIDFCAINGKY